MIIFENDVLAVRLYSKYDSYQPRDYPKFTGCHDDVDEAYWYDNLPKREYNNFCECNDPFTEDEWFREKSGFEVRTHSKFGDPIGSRSGPRNYSIYTNQNNFEIIQEQDSNMILQFSGTPGDFKRLYIGNEIQQIKFFEIIYWD